MTTETEFWALLYEGDDLDRTHTIVRRRPEPGGPVSEMLRSDGTWQTTGVVDLAELNMLEKELRRISAETARELEQQLLGPRPAPPGSA